MRCEPFITAMRSECVGVVHDDFVAEDFSKLRSELHSEQRRARQL
jgi:hypothetical protein